MWKWLQNHPKGLGIVVFTMWMTFLVFHGAGNYWEDQYPHGEVPWQLEWFTEVFENMQSESGQVFLMVALTAYLIFKGSAESRDSDDEMKKILERIERKLDGLG